MNMNASFVIVSVLLMLTRCVLVILMVEFIIIIIIFEIHIYKFIVRKSLLLHILFHLKKKKIIWILNILLKSLYYHRCAAVKESF